MTEPQTDLTGPKADLAETEAAGQKQKQKETTADLTAPKTDLI